MARDRLQILVIEDDELVRETLSSMLRRAGHGVRVADSGDAGLEDLGRSIPDVVIADVLMPGKGGLETILEMRRTRPKMKILAISGGGARRDLSYLRLAGRLGADAVLTKPFTPADIEAALAGLCAGDRGDVGT